MTVGSALIRLYIYLYSMSSLFTESSKMSVKWLCVGRSNFQHIKMPSSCQKRERHFYDLIRVGCLHSISVGTAFPSVCFTVDTRLLSLTTSAMQDNPLNLSISLSGGQENNCDSLSNGE